MFMLGWVVAAVLVLDVITISKEQSKKGMALRGLVFGYVILTLI